MARRGRLIAHEIEKAKREGYLIAWRKKQKPANPDQPSGWYSSMRDQFRRSSAKGA